MQATTRGLPNTCSICGADAGAVWYAENDEQAFAGRGLCAACAGVQPAAGRVFPFLPERVEDVLLKSGYRTIDALQSASDEELLALDGVGPATLRKIRRALAWHSRTT